MIEIDDSKRAAEIAECESKGHGDTFINRVGDIECIRCGATLEKKAWSGQGWSERYCAALREIQRRDAQGFRKAPDRSMIDDAERAARLAKLRAKLRG